LLPPRSGSFGARLAGMKVRRVIATGESQAGRRLTQYYNSIDPLHRVVDGMVFYDPGYSGIDGQGTWHLLRKDNPTKLISVGAEVWSDGREAVPDSPTTRRWEVAGSRTSVSGICAMSMRLRRGTKR
jgi:hypothetical protein